MKLRKKNKWAKIGNRWVEMENIALREMEGE